MGKPILPTVQEPYRDDPDAVSLRTTPGDLAFDDDAPNISPPAYEDDLPSSSNAPFLYPHNSQRVEVSDSHTVFLGKPINVVNGVDNRQDARCDSDPKHLEDVINNLSWIAPNPMIHIVGTHRETVRKGNKTETEHITDFRITLNMTDYLFPAGGVQAWRPPLHMVENGEKALRGGIMASRAPGYKAELEVGDVKPTLTEWCHRYCASGTYLKVFRLTRKVTGFDQQHLKSRLEGIIRGTGYRGSLSITFPVASEYVDLYSTNRVNTWRLTTWIRWVFYLTFLWIFTWPYLFFATKRYAVVKAEWPFSKVDAAGNKIYATYSEEQWLQRYAAAIQQLAYDRFQGDASHEYLGQVLARPDCGRRNPNAIRTGNASMDQAIGIFQGGLRAANSINNVLRFGNDVGPQEGWGYDT